MYPKFVLVTSDGESRGTLRMGKVWNHADLVAEGETCHGGGWFERNDFTQTIILYGESIDFGQSDMSYLDRISSTLKDYSFYFSEVRILYPDSEKKTIDLTRIEWV